MKHSGMTLRLIVLVIGTMFCLAWMPTTTFAISCSPGQASVIGTEYIASTCPGSSTYTYRSVDLICTGIIQRDPNSSGDMLYENVTPSYMQDMILSVAPFYSAKVFRNTSGTNFVMVGSYFASLPPAATYR